MARAENLLDYYWREADKHFPFPENLTWKYFPLKKVVSGKWYNNETLRKTSCIFFKHIYAI